MAIYHLSVKPISRKGGRSATAAAAYRAAEIVHDETTGQTFDYTRKRGVEHTEIVLPTHAAKQDINWARDRQQLWNAAEQAENRSNSRVAREYELALPHELTPKQRIELVRTFAVEIADRHGVAVDFAIHAPHREGDDRNHHAHILATTRVIEPGGLGEKATIEWSDGNRRKAELGPAKDEITAIRERWAVLTNERLQEQGLEARVDHRTLEAQGIDREPTVHLGPSVWGMQRRGMVTEVGQRLEREALELAQRRLELAAEAGRIERESAVVEKSMLDLTGDLASAKEERNRQPIPERSLASKPKTMEELQREGREAWLAMRASQPAEQERARSVPEIAPEASGNESQPKRTLSPEEQRAEAIERWRAYREKPPAEREVSMERGRKNELAKDEPQGPELEGPEIE